MIAHPVFDFDSVLAELDQAHPDNTINENITTAQVVYDSGPENLIRRTDQNGEVTLGVIKEQSLFCYRQKARLSATAVSGSNQKTVWIFAGGNRAGKSTYFRKFLKPRGIYFINEKIEGQAS